SWMIVLGIGLLVLGLVGIAAGSDTVATLDLVAAAISIAGGAVLVSSLARFAHVGEPLILSAGLWVVWATALADGAPQWQVWWNLALAGGYLVLVFVAAGAAGRWYARDGF